jgi:hypothetical protein
MIYIKNLVEISPFVPDFDVGIEETILSWITNNNTIIIYFEIDNTISFTALIKGEDACRGFFKQEEIKEDERILSFFKDLFDKFKERM